MGLLSLRALRGSFPVGFLVADIVELERDAEILSLSSRGRKECGEEEKTGVRNQDMEND